MDSLVSTAWLEAELGAPDLRVVDASFFLAAMGRDAKAEYAAAHIPGAVFFDIDEIADLESPFPHMLPSDHKFASRMMSLGIGDGSRVVVYDNSPLHSAARAWWMLRAFGASQVALLDGGLQKWTAEGRPLAAGAEPHRHGHFTPLRDHDAAIDKAGLLALDGHEIVDARSAPRFSGEEAEPRPGLAAGHIPGSRNVPQSAFFSADNIWKQDDALRAVFDAAGVDLGKPMVTTCGSGVTAAVILFGAHLLGKEDVRLYDGSWSEWGADPATPKATGAA
ncbi:MAG TPA: 3-mercaptopyruvate sulfurtransferase [Allosphingosinicella sp.]|nr:3-mercaptopyruvate sulfurtransferase [Allosphingosinicella sp.]